MEDIDWNGDLFRYEPNGCEVNRFRGAKMMEIAVSKQNLHGGSIEIVEELWFFDSTYIFYFVGIISIAVVVQLL